VQTAYRMAILARAGGSPRTAGAGPEAWPVLAGAPGRRHTAARRRQCRVARVPGREPYRVRLHPHGVPGAPRGPAGAVRRGTRFRSSSSGQAFPLSCRRESRGCGDGQAGPAEPLGCTHSRRAATRAGGWGGGRLRRDRVPAATYSPVHGKNDRRLGHRDGATCLPLPTGNPVQAGDARGGSY
jgi:hypothetical protein